MTLSFKRINPDAVLPSYADGGAAVGAGLVPARSE